LKPASSLREKVNIVPVSKHHMRVNLHAVWTSELGGGDQPYAPISYPRKKFLYPLSRRLGEPRSDLVISSLVLAFIFNFSQNCDCPGMRFTTLLNDRASP